VPALSARDRRFLAARGFPSLEEYNAADARCREYADLVAGAVYTRTSPDQTMAEALWEHLLFEYLPQWIRNYQRTRADAKRDPASDAAAAHPMPFRVLEGGRGA
jgi:hypothetical protein